MATLIIISLTLLVISPAWAQFPAVCNTPDSLSTKTCCPDNCGTRGACVSIREEVERSWDAANETIVKLLRGMPGWPQDVRYQWPLKIFEKVCTCEEGWGGYDCKQCDFGFIANEDGECVKRNNDQLLVRRNFRYLSEQERRDYITLVEAAKNEEEKKWAAITSVPEEPNGYYNLQNVSTYDMLVFTHVLSIREKVSTSCPKANFPNATEDIKLPFAHLSTPFLPWHRYFMLIYEKELRRIAEGMGISDFALPYWDWTPAGSCLIFTHELFGTPEYSDELVNVSGTLFENGKWPVVCDLQYRARTERQKVIISTSKCAKERILCDVEGDRLANRPLQRGAWHAEMRGLWLPDDKAIAMTLPPDQFDGTFGFAVRLEGFVEQCEAEPMKCMYEANDRDNTHTLVHQYVGGHMSSGVSSPNDPVFFLHHGNVERIYERWLQKYNGTPPSYQPVEGGPPGHNLNDYLVPLFPVRKIADFYQESKELGYIFDELPWTVPETDYQVGCPTDECRKGGYPPTVLVDTVSAFCIRLRARQKVNGRTEQFITQNYHTKHTLIKKQASKQNICTMSNC